MTKRFTFYSEGLGAYGFVKLALLSPQSLIITYKKSTIKISGDGLFLKYYGDDEALIAGKILRIDIEDV